MLGSLRAAFVLTLLSACSPIGVLNTLAPRAGVTTTSDLSYAPGARATLDIYAPTAAVPTAPCQIAMAEGVPVVVFFYGGGWKDGDKAAYRFVGATLAARGFLTVVPDYRLFPDVRFPVFLQDAAAAVAWVHNNIARYGGDPHRIFLMGHSAGAHIAAMLTLDRQWLAADGLDPDRDIKGMVGLAGPYDFLPLHDPELDDIFAPADDLRLTQPITFARGDAPPLFLAAGADDTTVLPRNTINLAAAVHREGGQVEERLYPGISHRLILGAIAAPLRWLAPVLHDVLEFLHQHAGPIVVDRPAGFVAAVRPASVSAGATAGLRPERPRPPGSVP